MKGKIVRLEWIPGFNIKSSKGHNKSDIKKAIQNADFVKNNGFGNYVDRLTKKVRQNIEKLLPLTVVVSEDGIKLDFIKHQKVGVEYK